MGSAKVSPEVLKRVPHHLINILSYKVGFNAGDFVRLAEKAVRGILERGKVPVLCGGTAFYYRNFLYGLPAIPPVEKGIRQGLLRELRERGLPALYEELVKLDPPTAWRLAPGDRNRIVRALEVCRGTGWPLSAYPLCGELRRDYSILLLGLTCPRSELYEKINRRVVDMFDQGLEEEVRGLLAQGARPEDPGMRGIGYREFFIYLRKGCMTRPELLALIQQNSRRYAKRQMTFFRSLGNIRWYNPQEEKALAGELERFLN